MTIRDCDTDDLVTFGEYTTDVDANIVRGVLETNGIPAVIDNAIMATMLPGSAIGGYYVKVLRRDLAQARRIMSLPPLSSDS